MLRILFKNDKQALRKNLCCTSQKPPRTKTNPQILCLGLLAAQTLRVFGLLPKSVKQTSKLIPVQENVSIMFLGSRKCLLQYGGGYAFPWHLTLSWAGLSTLPSLDTCRRQKKAN